MKNILNSLVLVAGIAGVVFMEWNAMEHGHDGMLLMASVAVVAGLGGYKIPGLINQLKGKKS